MQKISFRVTNDESWLKYHNVSIYGGVLLVLAKLLREQKFGSIIVR